MNPSFHFLWCTKRAGTQLTPTWLDANRMCRGLGHTTDRTADATRTSPFPGWAGSMERESSENSEHSKQKRHAKKRAVEMVVTSFGS